MISIAHKCANLKSKTLRMFSTWKVLHLRSSSIFSSSSFALKGLGAVMVSLGEMKSSLPAIIFIEGTKGWLWWILTSTAWSLSVCCCTLQGCQLSGSWTQISGLWLKFSFHVDLAGVTLHLRSCGWKKKLCARPIVRVDGAWACPKWLIQRRLCSSDCRKELKTKV